MNNPLCADTLRGTESHKIKSHESRNQYITKINQPQKCSGSDQSVHNRSRLINWHKLSSLLYNKTWHVPFRHEGSSDLNLSTEPEFKKAAKKL